MYLYYYVTIINFSFVNYYQMLSMNYEIILNLKTIFYKYSTEYSVCCTANATIIILHNYFIIN